jgi:proline iminopeptidase
MHREGLLVDIGDTRLFVVEVGPDDAYPILILHGGPGLDHHEFGDYLDPLAERGYRLIFVDQRSQGRSDKSPPETWTLERMAADVSALARSLRLHRYAVLGESFGAFVALQHAVDRPGDASQTIVSGGVPSARWLAVVDRNLEALEPPAIRDQVKRSWEKEASVETAEEFAQLMHEQWPFHFRDPLDPRIEEYEQRTKGWVFAPDVLRAMSDGYGGIDVEDRLGEVPQPVLLLAGRHDRVCSLEAHEFMAAQIPNAELVVFEESGHMTFVEENEKYLRVVDDFLRRSLQSALGD